jgi:hypothetical protein
MAQNPPPIAPTANSLSNNPYLQIVDKKLRLIRKKKAKLEGIQATLASGKKINADQQESLKQKDTVLKINAHLVELIELMNEHAKNDEKLEEQKRVQFHLESAKVVLSLFFYGHQDASNKAIVDFRNSVFDPNSTFLTSYGKLEKLFASSNQDAGAGTSYQEIFKSLSSSSNQPATSVSDIESTNNSSASPAPSRFSDEAKPKKAGRRRRAGKGNERQEKTEQPDQSDPVSDDLLQAETRNVEDSDHSTAQSETESVSIPTTAPEVADEQNEQVTEPNTSETLVEQKGDASETSDNSNQQQEQSLEMHEGRRGGRGGRGRGGRRGGGGGGRGRNRGERRERVEGEHHERADGEQREKSENGTGDSRGRGEFGERRGRGEFGERRGRGEYGERRGRGEYGERRGRGEYGERRGRGEFGERRGRGEFGERRGRGEFGDRRGRGENRRGRGGGRGPYVDRPLSTNENPAGGNNAMGEAPSSTQ